MNDALNASSAPPGQGALWTWPLFGPSAATPDYSEYTVMANDGEIGTVDSHVHDANRGHVVIDTGNWLVGRKALIPATAVRAVDDRARTIQVDLTKDQIGRAPEYDEQAGYDGYRDLGASYYRGLFPGEAH